MLVDKKFHDACASRTVLKSLKTATDGLKSQLSLA